MKLFPCLDTGIITCRDLANIFVTRILCIRNQRGKFV